MVYNLTGRAYLNASTWLGETLLGLNGAVGYIDRHENFESLRVPQGDVDAARTEVFGDRLVTDDFEFGLDAERRLDRETVAKALLLVHGSLHENRNDPRVIEADGSQSLYILYVSGSY